MPILDFFIEHDVKQKSYNITPETETELLDTALTVERLGGKGNGVIVANDGYGLNYSGSNALLKKEFPNVKFTPLEKAIEELFTFYSARKNTLDINLLKHDK